MDSYPAPSIVGKAFVKQYYTQMHRDPTQLHRFYLEQSSFVHGGADIGSEDPVIGQKCIHDKIKSLDLSQVHAKIKQVDSHATLGNGIVVQVTGELSTGGRPMRAFVQTFVLAPESPKKYYVHNDIFRYQDDDLSESETNETPGDGETPGMIEPAEDTMDYSAPPSHPAVDAAAGKVGVASDGEVGMFPSQGSAGEQAGTHEVGVVTTDGWDQQAYEDSTHLRQNGLPEEPEAQETEEFSMEPPSHVASVGDQGADVTMGDGGGGERYSPQEVHKEEKGAMSWASRLQGGSSQNRPLNSTSVSGAQTLPQRDPPRQHQQQRRPQAPPTNHAPSASSKVETAKKPPGTLNSREAPDAWQIFVGGLPPNASPDDIRGVFSGYDAISEVRVNPKNFAFVVFTGPDPVEKIMADKNNFQLHGKSLNIENKRSSGGRGGQGGFSRKPFGGGGGGGMGGKIRSNAGGGGSGGGGGGKGVKR